MEGIFPDYFKIARFIAIYKNGDKEIMNSTDSEKQYQES